MYWIVKRNRLATCSYRGPTWEVAGIRSYYKDYYEDYEEAARLASILSEYNLAGFDVVLIEE